MSNNRYRHSLHKTFRESLDVARRIASCYAISPTIQWDDSFGCFGVYVDPETYADIAQEDDLHIDPDLTDRSALEHKTQVNRTNDPQPDQPAYSGNNRQSAQDSGPHFDEEDEYDDPGLDDDIRAEQREAEERELDRLATLDTGGPDLSDDEDRARSAEDGWYYDD